MMYYIYILYSNSSDIYYVGHTDDFLRRLEEHNHKPYNTFTSKHRPWVLKAVFECGEERGAAMKLERYIKKQKSRNLIELLCQEDFVPSGKLAQLIRAPHLRD